MLSRKGWKVNLGTTNIAIWERIREVKQHLCEEVPYTAEQGDVNLRLELAFMKSGIVQYSHSQPDHKYLQYDFSVRYPQVIVTTHETWAGLKQCQLNGDGDVDDLTSPAIATSPGLILHFLYEGSLTR